MIKVTVKGDFSKTLGFIERIRELVRSGRLDYYGRQGVTALKAVTPVDTGKTAESWDYKIVHGLNKVSIYWTNDNFDKNGTPIAVILQYGHATVNGGFVQGIDYINPAIRPIFEQMANDIREEVSKR